MEREAALTLWAKSSPFRSLLAHMLDAAAVAWALLEREPPRTQRLYAEDWGLSEGEALRFAAFLVGLHDLGKATPVFQAQWPEGARRVKMAGLTWEEGDFRDKEDWVAHGVFTELLAFEALKALGLPRRVARGLAQGLGAHHGFPAGEEEKRKADRKLALEDPPWKEARAFLVEALRKALGVKVPPIQEARPEALLRIMALASFADWIASDPGFYTRVDLDPLDPRYLDRAREEATRVLDALPWRVPSLPQKAFQEVFPFPPNPLQAALPELLGGATESVLLLVEAPMGLGKTEAALYAYLLLQRLGHRGLYVALPTQATANGLFVRVRAFLEGLGVDAPLDLQLQHGAAPLNPQYQELRERARPKEVYDEEAGAWEAGVAASGWFSAKKRAMLSPHGVGTLDQALLGVLKVKHHFVRLWGLMNRVVVLDEVHAYDTYTSGLLKALLLWLRALGSSVVLMTATLPSAKRKELLGAWGVAEAALAGLPPYPRVAAFAGERLLGGRALPVGEGKAILLERAPLDLSSLSQALLSVLPGCLGAVANTVDRAQDLYRSLGQGEPLTLAGLLDLFPQAPKEGPWGELCALREERGKAVVGKRLGDGTLVFLLHARFPAEERALREAVVLALFGKRGPRPERAILVATQVVEQSLDLDFDLLYSDLAPIDLLFQRVGRLWRHGGRDRKGHGRPRLWVGGLEGPEAWRGLHWNRVYEDYILLSTWLSLKDREALKVPEDLGGLLEEVYGRSPQGFPPEWARRAEQSYKSLQNLRQKEEEMAKNLALSRLDHLLPAQRGQDLPAAFRLEDEAEDEKTQRLLTRLGPPQVAVVPLYRKGEEYFLDPEGLRPARLRGELSPEEVLTLWGRAVRLSRKPIPETLLAEDPPPAWQRHALLRGLRPLEVGRFFPRERGGVSVELDPELGVVYQEAL